ncbi:hypothetical protein FA10DRAFT_269989 [Acaromyces ingoldii]|uniref:Uncharacterized protein n=1 Tax=Acaromyces ingoldii TaxID=215250 RepID=A0A316YBF6_9BASI|nr:hypothetical protein FA10DRAFT_269989 [Acaromyces ingoldii]PWN86906.1 hypothetical protein FA10DRAFT_269989 [Acaromyces ingoldii]
MPAELSCHRCRILAADCVFVRSGASAPDRQEQKARKTRRSKTACEENAARQSQTQETGDERTTETDTFHQDAILQPREILDGDDRSSEPVRDSTAWLERTRSSFRSYSYLALVMRRLHVPREERTHSSLSLGSILAGANIDWATCGEVLNEVKLSRRIRDAGKMSES